VSNNRFLREKNITRAQIKVTALRKKKKKSKREIFNVEGGGRGGGGHEKPPLCGQCLTKKNGNLELGETPILDVNQQKPTAVFPQLLQQAPVRSGSGTKGGKGAPEGRKGGSMRWKRFYEAKRKKPGCWKGRQATPNKRSTS